MNLGKIRNIFDSRPKCDSLYQRYFVMQVTTKGAKLMLIFLFQILSAVLVWWQGGQCCGMEGRRGWQGMDLMGDLLEPATTMEPIFPRCSPKSSPTNPATTNTTYNTSMHSTRPSDNNLNNKQKNSPDFNQNKAAGPQHCQTKLSRMAGHISNRWIHYNTVNIHMIKLQ